MNYVSLIGLSHKECQNNEPLWQSYVKILTQWSTFQVYYIERNDHWQVIHDNSYGLPLCHKKLIYKYLPYMSSFMSICTTTTSTLLQYDHVYSCYCCSSIIWGYLCYIKDNLQSHTHKFMTLLNDEQRLMIIIHELSDVQSLMKKSLTKQWTNLSDDHDPLHMKATRASYKLNNVASVF